MATVVFIATYDTKGVESDYIKKRVEAYGAKCVTLDVGVGGVPTAVPDVSLADLCAGSEYTVDIIHAMPRGDAVGAASDLVEKYVQKLFAAGECHAVIGIGGAGGTQICTQTMRSMSCMSAARSDFCRFRATAAVRAAMAAAGSAPASARCGG